MAMRTPDQRRCLIVSHGHYTESIYSLMSTLKDTLYPSQRASGFEDIETLEEENFAWIDFFWSTLGQSGEVGTDMGMIYADLTSPADIDALVSNLTSGDAGQGQGACLAAPGRTVGGEQDLPAGGQPRGHQRARHARRPPLPPRARPGCGPTWRARS